jgi:RNA polymerase sigma-70 factor (ECF subfamily)
VRGKFGSLEKENFLKILAPEYKEASEESLLNWFNGGDKQALEALIIRREKWLWAAAKKSIRDVSLAEEALQEALVLIWRNAHTFRGESLVSTWMYQIVSRACIDVLRKEQIRSHAHLNDIEQSDDLGGSSRFEDSLVDTLFIHTALLQLENEHRDVITLIDLEGRSVQEASELLGIPVGTVKSRAARGREALKAIVIKVLATNGNQTEVSNVIPLGVKNGKKR